MRFFSILSLVLLSALLSATETVAFLGDSLTAGYGIEADDAYPAQIQRRMRRDGLDWRVVNAGVSGDTTRGGLERVDWVLRTRPQVVVLALGANDGLRGLPLERVKENLAAIVRRLREAEVRVVLCGMRLPTNLGDEYCERFRALYPELAEEHELPFYPFLLEGVATRPELNLADGVHPNRAGHRAIAERLDAFLRPILRGDPKATPLAAEAAVETEAEPAAGDPGLADAEPQPAADDGEEGGAEAP